MVSPNFPILTVSNRLSSSGSFIISGLFAISSSKVPNSFCPDEIGAACLTVFAPNLGFDDETFGGSDVIVEVDPLYWPPMDPALPGLADYLLDAAELSALVGLVFRIEVVIDDFFAVVVVCDLSPDFQPNLSFDYYYSSYSFSVRTFVEVYTFFFVITSYAIANLHKILGSSSSLSPISPSYSSSSSCSNRVIHYSYVFNPPFKMMY